MDIGRKVLECVETLKSTRNLTGICSHRLYDKTAQFTLAEVTSHCDSTSCWLVLFDKVYDVTEFLKTHPGGEEIILENAGIDATVPYDSKGHTDLAHALLEPYCIGELVQSDRRYKTGANQAADD